MGHPPKVSIPERGLGWLEPPEKKPTVRFSVVSIPERGLGWLERRASESFGLCDFPGSNARIVLILATLIMESSFLQAVNRSKRF